MGARRYKRDRAAEHALLDLPMAPSSGLIILAGGGILPPGGFWGQDPGNGLADAMRAARVSGIKRVSSITYGLADYRDETSKRRWYFEWKDAPLPGAPQHDEGEIPLVHHVQLGPMGGKGHLKFRHLVSHWLTRGSVLAHARVRFGDGTYCVRFVERSADLPENATNSLAYFHEESCKPILEVEEFLSAYSAQKIA